MASETYTIGKVVKMLQDAYPSLSVSKVRFLETSGLLKPRRTKSGYRVYTEADVERLRTILRLQETCFYPLSVIKEKLAQGSGDQETPQASAGEGSGREVDLPAGPIVVEDAHPLLGIPPRFVRSLADNGLIRLVKNNERRDTFDGADAALIASAYELTRHGIDPRFLKTYLQRANRDVPLFKQALMNQLGRKDDLEDPRARKVFDDTLDRLVELTSTVEERLVRRGVEEEFGVG